MGCGLRKLTINHLIAAKLAEQAQGLPPGVKHPNQLLAAMRRSAPYLHHARLLPLMEELFRWTQPQDWAPDCEPVVWPSNDDLANALGCSERHISRLIAAAVEARVIVPRDGSDRKRRGFRKDGRIIWAWGLNLRPMAARYAEFRLAAEEGERARRECQVMRRQASALRQTVQQLMALAQHSGVSTEALNEGHSEALQLCAALRGATDPAALVPRLAALQNRIREAAAWLERLVKDADMSGSADSDGRLILPTNTITEPKGSTVAAQEKPLPSPAPPTAEDEFSLSPGELIRLAPGLQSYLPTDRPSWSELSNAASALAQHLGISRSLYGEACQALGRMRAAVAIAVISTKAEGYFHSSGPGGYLRGMLRRANEGKLHLERSIFGLRDASNRRQLLPSPSDGPGLRKLTAVNFVVAPYQGWREMRYGPTHAPVAASASGTHG
jgi:replication initiation protein RepC